MIISWQCVQNVAKIIFGTYRRDARKQKNFRPSAHSATEAELKKKNKRNSVEI